MEFAKPYYSPKMFPKLLCPEEEYLDDQDFHQNEESHDSHTQSRRRSLQENEDVEYKPHTHQSEPHTAEFISNSKQPRKQSLMKNANKYFLSNLLNYLQDSLPYHPEYQHLMKYIIRVKGTGKMKNKVDIFTLAHFRVLFLQLNDWNINQLQQQDVKLHREIFSELSEKKSWNEDDLHMMNHVKQGLFELSIEYFEEKNELREKIQKKDWGSQDMQQGYMEWVSRVAKGVRKLHSGVYVNRFQNILPVYNNLQY